MTALPPQVNSLSVHLVLKTPGRSRSIEPWKDSAKFVVKFSESAREIGLITLVKGGRVKALQNLRYPTLKKLMEAKTLDDVW